MLQILWLGKPELQCSWVHSDNVPEQVISEYKNSDNIEVLHNTTIYKSHQTTTVTVEKSIQGTICINIIPVHTYIDNTLIITHHRSKNWIGG